MHLHELLGLPGPMTHRQFVGWLAWQAAQWNTPSRADWYAMQTACEARRALLKEPNALAPRDMKLTFAAPGGQEEYEPTLEEATAWSKAKWGG